MRRIALRMGVLFALLTLGPLVFYLAHPGSATDSARRDSDDTDSVPAADSVEINPGAHDSGAPAGDGIAFTTRGGRRGWKVTFPQARQLATPAVVDGRVFLGGGFGSHEFYAFDAQTGKRLWLYRTKDDGPTAAAVEDGYVAFNTESCELEILTVDGKPVWKKWLGDPLMSMPAVSGGKVYMAYPDSKGDQRHHLACFALKTGKEHWKQPISGGIITAPVLREGRVYLATVDGSVCCFAEGDGALAWTEQTNATSSPTVWEGKCYFSRREAVKEKGRGDKPAERQTEQLASRGMDADGSIRRWKATTRPADYLDFSRRKRFSASEKVLTNVDAEVGFVAGASLPAVPNGSMSNIGQGTVAGTWSYQGSRPFVGKGRLYSSMGDTMKCVDPKTEKVVWEKSLQPKEYGPLVDATLTPPALANGRLFVGTARGEIVCLEASTGKELWRATLGEPVVFQPAVARGRVYIATSKGTLYCLETGDPKDDGWLMWGRNASHTGLVD